MLLTYEQMSEHLKTVTYLPGWEMSLYVGATEGIHCLIKASINDNFNPGQKFSFEVYSPVPPQVSIESFNLWLNWRLMRIAIHESCEQLQINGEAIVNPHRENGDRDML